MELIYLNTQIQGWGYSPEEPFHGMPVGMPVLLFDLCKENGWRQPRILVAHVTPQPTQDFREVVCVSKHPESLMPCRRYQLKVGGNLRKVFMCDEGLKQILGIPRDGELPERFWFQLFQLFHLSHLSPEQ